MGIVAAMTLSDSSGTRPGPAIPDSMPAIGLYRGLPVSDEASLQDLTLPVPRPAGHDLLVEVHAVSVNPVDVKTRASSPASDSPRVIGYDAVGVVRAIGDAVTLFQPDDRVWYAGSIARPGSNSRFQLVSENIVGHSPTSLGDAEAAALPLTGITAWEGLFDHLGLTADSQGFLLVVGAAGGVGSMVIQLAKALTGLTVIAVASRDDSARWVADLGADHVVGRDFADVRGLAPDGVDYVFSAFSAQNLPGIAEVIKPLGHVVSIDTSAPGIDALKPKSVTWHWEYMFTRAVQLPDDTHQHHVLNALGRLADEGRIRSTLTTALEPLDAATLRHAHALVESSATIGKVVVSGWPR